MCNVIWFGPGHMRDGEILLYASLVVNTALILAVLYPQNGLGFHWKDVIQFATTCSRLLGSGLWF